MEPLDDKEWTSKKAADLMGVSPHFMIARIDAGDNPVHRVAGAERLVLESEVLMWHEQSRAQQREAMRKLAERGDDEYS
jgi:hypothetical protein